MWNTGIKTLYIYNVRTEWNINIFHSNGRPKEIVFWGNETGLPTSSIPSHTRMRTASNITFTHQYHKKTHLNLPTMAKNPDSTISLRSKGSMYKHTTNTVSALLQFYSRSQMLIFSLLTLFSSGNSKVITMRTTSLVRSVLIMESVLSPGSVSSFHVRENKNTLKIMIYNVYCKIWNFHMYWLKFYYFAKSGKIH